MVWQLAEGRKEGGKKEGKDRWMGGWKFMPLLGSFH